MHLIDHLYVCIFLVLNALPKQIGDSIKALRNGVFSVSDVLRLASRRHLVLLSSPAGVKAVSEGVVTFEWVARTRDIAQVERRILKAHGGGKQHDRKRGSCQLGSRPASTKEQHAVTPKMPPLLNRETLQQCERVNLYGDTTSCDAVSELGGTSACVDDDDVDDEKAQGTFGYISRSTSAHVQEMLMSKTSPHIICVDRNEKDDDEVLDDVEVATCDNEVPSSEKLSILEQFLAVTDSNDETKAIKVLCACSWDLSNAIGLHYAAM
jgi:hypothetical protein